MPVSTAIRAHLFLAAVPAAHENGIYDAAAFRHALFLRARRDRYPFSVEGVRSRAHSSGTEVTENAAGLVGNALRSRRAGGQHQSQRENKTGCGQAATPGSSDL